MKTLSQIFDNFPDIQDGRVSNDHLMEAVREWYWGTAHPQLQLESTLPQNFCRVLDKGGFPLGFMPRRDTVDKVFQLVLPATSDHPYRFVTLERVQDFYVLREGDAQALTEQLEREAEHEHRS